MKYLVLVRHATAEVEPSQRDFERRLSRIGAQEASQTGKALLDLWKAHQIDPPILKASPAERTQETGLAIWNSFHNENLIHGPLDKDNQLYRGDLSDWIDAIKSTDEAINAVILVGHNPGISLFASEMARSNFNFQPSRYLVLQSKTTWDGCDEASWHVFASSL
jgi:phosphohistidine phosphatase